MSKMTISLNDADNDFALTFEGVSPERQSEMCEMFMRYHFSVCESDNGSFVVFPNGERNAYAALCGLLFVPHRMGAWGATHAWLSSDVLEICFPN
jgi:hypothetical protein